MKEGVCMHQVSYHSTTSHLNCSQNQQRLHYGIRGLEGKVAFKLYIYYTGCVSHQSKLRVSQC